MSWHFHELFSKKLQKVPHFVEKHEKSLIWPKVCNFFEQTTMSLHFDQLFRKKLQKVPHFVKQQEKSLIWPKLATFSNKVPCLCVSMNFSAKGCKKCLVSWKSTKNHPFGQNFLTFRTNYHVFAFRWTFPEKVAKSASFREKARKVVDLPKTCNCSTKLPCFGVLVNFSAKSCKKWLISSRSTKNHRFAQNLELFDETTMFRRFGHFFRKKLQKRAHFVKKHEKSSIWPKVATFPANYHVSAFWSTFQQKGGESGLFREKWRKIIDLA